MATATLPPPGTALTDLTHRELIQLQWHFGIAADPDPAFSTDTRHIVKRFCRITEFSGMQIILVRSNLGFADEELLNDLNSPGAALRLVPLPRRERLR
jgi:hypothetical protein